jgi:hypothetical protein
MTKTDNYDANEKIACDVLRVPKLFKKIVVGMAASFSKQHGR